MKQTVALLLLIAGCAREPVPRYMQDEPRTQEDVKASLAEIQKELGKTFSVVQQDEFFYIASNANARLTKRCKGTVSRMYQFLYRDFLKKKPTKPILIYLFKDKPSYEAYCKRAYRRPPSTPFGFYMPSERKMVMNIATGTGTLAHEMVHPLLAEDFEEVPSWYNEGFASLYEQSWMTREGKMEGLANWRLPGLQRALKNGTAISLRSLMKTTTDEFYGDSRGVNYATARYLCMYLQEKGLLQKYYREFKKGFKKDGTGIRALEKVTGQKLDDLQTAFRKWVRALRYDR